MLWPPRSLAQGTQRAPTAPSRGRRLVLDAVLLPFVMLPPSLVVVWGGKELNGRAELIRKQLAAPGGHLAIFGCMSLLTFSMLGIGQPRTLAPTSGAARWLEPGVRGCGFRAVALSLRGPFASTPFVGRRCLVRMLVMEAPRTTWLSTHSQRGRGFSSPATGGGCGLLMAELAVCPRAHVVPATAGASSGEGHSQCPCEWHSGHWLEQIQVSPWHWGGSFHQMP